jgi:predicted HTH transcriptional regulator
MNTKELEELLEAGSESQRLDFKESCAWDVKRFAKDILAFSNIKGGGYIIIGMKEDDEGFKRAGATEDHLASYDRDTMKDQMSSYADPGVDFLVHKISDRTGIKFLVIEIREFIDIPIICKKDGAGLTRATIYYRNIDKKPESAPISNSYDLRNLIELAAIKMTKKMRELRYVPKREETNKYDEELEGL